MKKERGGGKASLWLDEKKKRRGYPPPPLPKKDLSKKMMARISAKTVGDFMFKRCPNGLWKLNVRWVSMSFPPQMRQLFAPHSLLFCFALWFFLPRCADWQAVGLPTWNSCAFFREKRAFSRNPGDTNNHRAWQKRNKKNKAMAQHDFPPV